MHNLCYEIVQNNHVDDNERSKTENERVERENLRRFLRI